ncbi:hypothetical protein DAPPUDRAFT_336876 [Daphnia pulex]|uniref:CxC3 like cysteine cluster domain-containing protein n=1 Tax=Daphnia pulex TaxID=6669 RepID=E9I0I2_DAPPU|nr:hypothetical protein DAPPUDRAFT_336876 [Daphnia pulex]|eukprot:EFX62497.1 hypothetical protein DAPPUDRAFT_336876 [Daphnia pulex]
MPGTSMNKFIETLETLFDGQKPSRPINKIHFQNASRYYEHFMHQVDVKVKFKDKTVCLSCKGIMLASHCDGNFKLYRLLSALGINLSSSYGDVVIAFDEDMKNHRAEIDSKVPKSKSSQTCGDSIFKAARSDAGKFQKLDETGIMMRSYRHGIVDRAVNMHHGETFRHTHFMHLDLPEKACTFLCGDVIYRYWDWAKKVASLFPEYKPMIEGMKTFLGRMHAKVHVWYCQIIWVGHWMSEAALTLGEEQEQVDISKSYLFGVIYLKLVNRRKSKKAKKLV